MNNIDYRNDNTVIFTLARMNPPTPGHLYVIHRLIDTAISKNVDHVYIILSKTNDNNENPINCPEKINVLGTLDDMTKNMINSEKELMINETDDFERKDKIKNMNVIVICVPEQKGATPFTPLINNISEMSNISDVNLFLIIGDDRRNMLDSITDFFFKWDNVYSIDGIILPREEMIQYKEIASDPNKLDKINIYDVPINAISASFVRNIVKNNRFDKFFELYSPFLDEDKISRLYESILVGLELPPNKKQDENPKPLKYDYPMIKGLSKINIETPKTLKRSASIPSINRMDTLKRSNKRTTRGGKRKQTKKNKKNIIKYKYSSKKNSKKYKRTQTYK